MPALERRSCFLAFWFWRCGRRLEPALTTQDYGFVGIVGLMLLGAVWLFRAIGREMDNPGA